LNEGSGEGLGAAEHVHPLGYMNAWEKGVNVLMFCLNEIINP